MPARERLGLRQQFAAGDGTVTLRLRSRWVGLFLIFWGVVAFLFPSRMWLAVLAGLAILVGGAYGWARGLATGVRWERRLRQGIVVVGDALVEGFQGENSASVPVLWAEIVDHSDLPGYRANRVEAVEAHGRKRWEVNGVCRRRGVFHIGPWEVISGDPLGLFEVRWTYPQARQIVVYPRIVHLPPLDLPRGPGDAGARERRPAVQADVIAGGVRPYLPGDPLRHIHWRLTAHWGHLVTRVFDTEPSGDVWLVLDLDERVQAGEGERSTEEYMVTLAASLAARLLDEGRSVGALWGGRHPAYVPPQAGRGQLWRLLAHLAEARSAETLPLATLLERSLPLLGRGRTLVIFTPRSDSDWIPALLRARRADLSAAVVWLGPDSFAERRQETGEPPWAFVLARIGVPWHRITASFPLQVAIKVRRRRKVFRVLPGTGRVVVEEVVEEV